MNSSASEDLRTNMIGAWKLQSYESFSLDGSDVNYPLGVDAEGIIMYTADGYMSAQLMRSGRSRSSKDDPHPDEQDELASAAGGYLSYSGTYTVVGGDLIAHHVVVGLLPNWIGGTQYRSARIDGSVLELRPTEPILIRGELRNARLFWQRP